jgi:putative tricarboxylic transport membrane protein
MLYALTAGAMNQAILSGSPYGYKAFTPIANMAVEPSVLVVAANAPYKTLKDLIEAAKKAPKTILQGGGPYGNSASMEGHLLEDAAGVEFSYTPFKGGGEGVVALLGGHVQFLMENPAEVQANVTAGKMRILAASEKLSQYPDVPTFKEAGYDAQLIPQFRAVVAPPGIPPEVQAYYIDLLARTRQTQEWKDYVKKNALVESSVSGDDLTKMLDRQEPVFRKMDERMGLLKK